jgi:hypothetical protein
MAIELTCHAWRQHAAVRGIQARVRRSPDGALALTFRLDGELALLRVAAPGVPRIAHQLWEHTCFEAFVAVDGAAAYHEFNFAPSGEWAGYAFSSYRNVAGLADDTLAPHLVVRFADDRLELDALVALDRLSPVHARAPLRLGLAAVIELTDGTLSYWALCHPAGKPDFHHADTRVLRLEPTTGEW